MYASDLFPFGQIQKTNRFITRIGYKSVVPVFAERHIALKETWLGWPHRNHAFKCIGLKIKYPDLITTAKTGQPPRIHGPELECDADRLAIEMCIAAGYDPFECLKLFDKLEKISLDMNDLETVFGPDESDDELLPDASRVTKIKIWLYQRKRGYLPIRDRRQMLIHHLTENGITRDLYAA